MCPKSIEEFVIQNKLRPSLRVRILTLWPEIRDYRDNGYPVRTIWQYLLSEKKIPQISYSRFAAILHQLAEKQPMTSEKASAPTTAISETSVGKNKPEEYEPRRGPYREEAKPFIVTTTPPTFEQLFSRKLARERHKAEEKKEGEPS